MRDTADADQTELDALLQESDMLVRRMNDVREQIGHAVYGQAAVIDQVLTTLLAGGHLLLVGVPGLGKTLLVETMGQVLGLETRRIQFTPDLMPADILGSEVLEESAAGARSFRFIKGPVFTQLLMGDEINRAGPRTQSALLQAMQEYRVSIAGQYYDLPRPFHVLATQNPIEQEGTYPLPEAQLDRFLMQVDIGYPAWQHEREIMVRTTGMGETAPQEVLSAAHLQTAQRLVRRMPVGESVVEAILTLIRNARPESSDDDAIRRNIAWGPGPRAGQALMLAVRAYSLLDGRLAPSVDDVIALAAPVLRHRMAPTFTARADGIILEEVIHGLAARLT